MLPAPMQSRLHHLFREVEKEFEAVYLDNLRLREKIALMELQKESTTSVAQPRATCAKIPYKGDEQGRKSTLCTVHVQAGQAE